MAPTVARVQLEPDTLQAFQAYIHNAEQEMESSLPNSESFLWCLRDSARAQQMHAGLVLAQYFSGHGPVEVPAGLIHDWIGACFAAGATIEQTLAAIRNYDNHKNIYRPEVMDSRLLAHDGNYFRIYLRLLKKKIITVVLDTEHDVHYSQFDAASWSCRSCTTRTAEVENAGTAQEKTFLQDTGHGFLWRLDSFWRFQGRGGGVFIECRAISLSRNVPAGLGWIIDPIVRKLPRESLIKTLKDTRRAITDLTA